MLIYALGRGLDFRDVETVDRLVERIERENGHPPGAAHGHHRVNPVPEAPPGLG